MFEKEIYPDEIAEVLYNLSSDMDSNDYEENKATTILELKDALYQVLGIAENSMNSEYWRTLYKCLESVCKMNQE